MKHPPHERLRAWRVANKLSQGAAAARVGIEQGSWSEYERGLIEPSIGVAKAFERLTKGTPFAVAVAEWADEVKPKKRGSNPPPPRAA